MALVFDRGRDMASAQIQRTATEVVLRLTEEEAQFLLFILDSVGGDPERSPRRHQRAISNALSEHVRRSDLIEMWHELRDGSGFHFRNDDTRIVADKYRRPA